MNINKKNKVIIFLTHIVLLSVFLFFVIGFSITASILFDSKVDFMVAIKSTLFIMVVPFLFLIYFIFRTREDKRIRKTLFFLFIIFFFFFSLFAFNNFSLSLREFKDKIYFLVKYHEVMNEVEYRFYRESGRLMNEEEYHFYKEHGFSPIKVQDGCCGWY